MRYDTVIIGGGLSALMCGIEVARVGRKVALVATGHSTLHFSSCSFGLYNAKNPLQATSALPAEHPYSKIGVEDVEALAVRATEILNMAGIATVGSAEQSHYIVTPTGKWRECWLSLEGMLTSADGKGVDFSSAAIFYPEGFLDFYTQFIVDHLESCGVKVTTHAFALPELTVRRNNPTEMRSVAVARALDKQENIEALAQIISQNVGSAEAVIMPAVLGFDNLDVRNRLERAVDRQILCVPTLPPSVEGVKAERALRRTFESMGGTIFMAHTAVEYTLEQETITSITTSKGVTLTADDFVLASGSFIGGGLKGDGKRIEEALFGLDTLTPEDGYTTRNIFEAQPFMSCGVVVDNSFKAVKGGKAIENLYACGAVLAAYNPVKEGCGAGVAMLSALKVADDIINR